MRVMPGYFVPEAFLFAIEWHIQSITDQYFFCISVTYFDILVLAITNIIFSG